MEKNEADLDKENSKVLGLSFLESAELVAAGKERLVLPLAFLLLFLLHLPPHPPLELFFLLPPHLLFIPALLRSSSDSGKIATTVFFKVDNTEEESR